MSPKVTDEGITLPIDVGLAKAVCLPRIKEKIHTLCLDDLSTKSAPHPTQLTLSHLPPEGKAFSFTIHFDLVLSIAELTARVCRGVDGFFGNVFG